MDEIALARHGESEAAAAGLVGGDTPLTANGVEEARALGRRLGGVPIDVCVTSGARRARETAAVALEGRAVPIAVEDDLGDIRFGIFEGRPLAEYRGWIEAHRPDEAPPGGESRVDTLRRFAAAFRRVLARGERSLLVVAHGLTVRSVVDPRPQPIVAGTPYGGCVELRRPELEDAVDRLERWCDAPTW
jgi:broad specificity phosphatase PhoE